jgi:hypothetical protein
VDPLASRCSSIRSFLPFARLAFTRPTASCEALAQSVASGSRKQSSPRSQESTEQQPTKQRLSLAGNKGRSRTRAYEIRTIRRLFQVAARRLSPFAIRYSPFAILSIRDSLFAARRL